MCNDVIDYTSQHKRRRRRVIYSRWNTDGPLLQLVLKIDPLKILTNQCCFFSKVYNVTPDKEIHPYVYTYGYK